MTYARFVTAIAPMLWGTTYLVSTELMPAGRPLLTATGWQLPERRGPERIGLRRRRRAASATT